MGANGFDLTSEMSIGKGGAPLFIAGPCVIETEEQALTLAGRLKDIARAKGIQLIFKASFDKANRSSVDSFRGPGLEKGLQVLARIKEDLELPVISDVHWPEQAAVAAEILDILQVPAFLCRQTDLLAACGETGKPVNVKKGQFLAAEDMKNAVEKIHSTGNTRVLLTERGSSFGYHNLVVDMRGLPVMRRFAPVIFDATHSLQLPGGLGHATGGAREFHPYLARAAAAAGVDGFFVEVHTDPPNALSDATTQLTVEEFERVVEQVTAISSLARGFES